VEFSKNILTVSFKLEFPLRSSVVIFVGVRAGSGRNLPGNMVFSSEFLKDMEFNQKSAQLPEV